MRKHNLEACMTSAMLVEEIYNNKFVNPMLCKREQCFMK